MHRRYRNYVFINKSAVPADRTMSYVNWECNITPQKKETHRVHMTAGGKLLIFAVYPSPPEVSIIDAKLHIESTISDYHKGSRYLGIYIKNIYLGIPMKYYQYIRVLPSTIPQEIWDDPEYDIHPASDRFVYIKICRGMYVPNEDGVLSLEQLVCKLSPYGYAPMPFSPGYCKYDTIPTVFSMCVDNLGGKYFSKDDTMHLINAVKYEMVGML